MKNKSNTLDFNHQMKLHEALEAHLKDDKRKKFSNFERMTTVLSELLGFKLTQSNVRTQIKKSGFEQTDFVEPEAKGFTKVLFDLRDEVGLLTKRVQNLEIATNTYDEDDT